MNKNDWLDDAQCVGALRKFYEDVEGEDGSYDKEGLRVARSICDVCPVRRRCHVEAQADEAHRPVAERFGVRAGLTPEQRHSAVLRKTVVCPVCQHALDPKLVRDGIIVCPISKSHVNRVTVPIPELGDQWSKRHLTLTRRVLRYMEAHPRQTNMPSMTAMSEELGERWHDVKRVYEALIVDGTLRKQGKKFVRVSRSKRVDPDTWLPPHLR